eukprot:4089771-Pyramimonas_sp.AAC.1
MAISNYHKLESDMVDNKVEKHLLHHRRVTLLRDREPDWPRFDVQVSLQNSRSLDPSVVARELRKLRMRWFRAKEPKTRLVLSKI